ncbi:Mediator of RNA polymerase II transcription subunit 18 [Boothiomyces sp. JEL0866]|nr:Mediator of RNA polymerase II transcription subunit 18 [Boothiomyces sp. JEL0866]
MSIECSLYGYFADNKRKQLISLMTGISGKESETYCDHEIVYKPTIETPYGPQRNDDIVLSLISPVNGVELENRNWTLVQRCQPEPPKAGQKLANHRVIHSTILEGDALEFMKELGYRSYKLKDQHNIISAEPLDPSDHWIIDAKIMCNQEQVQQWSSKLFQIATQLSGLVDLKVVSHTSLQTKIKYSS